LTSRAELGREGGGHPLKLYSVKDFNAFEIAGYDAKMKKSVTTINWSRIGKAASRPTYLPPATIM
jgi:hypothetical protein